MELVECTSVHVVHGRTMHMHVCDGSYIELGTGPCSFGEDSGGSRK